jgi:two-component system, NarL family, invasion response regulator UvrY
MKVLLVDDHAIVRAGLKRLLGDRDKLPDAEIREAASGREALAQFRKDPADVVILDLNLPGGFGGLELLRRLLEEGSDGHARVLVFSMHADTINAARALQLGARGYLSKHAAPDEIIAAVRRVAEGGRYIEHDIAQELALQKVADGQDPLQQLSVRDLDILRLLAEGLSLAEIAAALGVGYKTIANRCTDLKSRLGVARTADLIRIALAIATP